MNLLLNTVTIRNASLEDKFRLAAQAGYDGLELWGDEIDEYPEGAAGIRALAARHRMPVVGICPHRALLDWHHRWDAALAEAFAISMRQYAHIGAKYLVLPVLSEDGTLDDTARSLRSITPIARACGIVPALEPIGHVNKLARFSDAYPLLAAMPEIGFIADVFHFFRGGNRLSDLAGLDCTRVTAAHLNDAMDLPLSELVGSKHRVQPGDGIFDVASFCAALEHRGYRGPHVLEILNPAIWDSDPAEVATAGFAACQKVMRVSEQTTTQ